MRFLRGFGSKGAIFCHCASVSNGPDRAIGPPSALLTLLIAHSGKLNHPSFKHLSPVMQQLLENIERWAFILLCLFGMLALPAKAQTNDRGHRKADLSRLVVSSLDGVHPTNTAYAVIANEFIKTLNREFSAGIPPVSVAQIAKTDPLILPGIEPQESLGWHVSPETAKSI